VLLAIAAHLRLDEIIVRARRLAPGDDYEYLAIVGAEASLIEAQRRLAIAYLRRPEVEPLDPAAWLTRCGGLATRAKADLDAIASAREMSLARLAVAAARLAGLAQAVSGATSE
jgi:NAD-specific glutamate dehydrogenase